MATKPVTPAAPGTKPRNGKREMPWYSSGLGASVASMCTHPLDLSKVRMQVSGPGHHGLLGTLAHSVRTAGLRRGAYTGLSASILRQMTYSTARFGAYPPLLAMLKKGQEKPAFYQLVLASSGAGAIGGFVGNPADIVLVRMTADGNKPPDKRYNYRNCFHGVYRILTEEGVAAFFRGLAPNTARAVLMNASQISTYDVFKTAILGQKTVKLEDGLLVHTLASTAAGTVATSTCSPFDVLKSRIMNAKGNESMLGVIRHSFERDGIRWTVITFVVLEQIRKLYTGHF